MRKKNLLSEKENHMKEELKRIYDLIDLFDEDRELIIEYIIKLNREYNYSKEDIIKFLNL